MAAGRMSISSFTNSAMRASGIFAVPNVSHVNAHRPGDADGIGDLHFAASGQAGGDDVFGDVAGRIGRRPVHLRRVLAGEGAATVPGIPPTYRR